MRLSILRTIFASLVLITFLLVWLPRSYRPTFDSLPSFSWTHQTLSREEERARVIREAFIHAWGGYKAHAFPHDMLHPLSNGFEDDRNGWGVTAVDALPAAIVMEVPEVVNQILNHIPTINWNKVTSKKVAIFGSTIRYLGGMLSAYDLLTTTHTHLTNNTAAVSALLGQSQSLADALSPSFLTPQGINHNQLLFPKHTLTNLSQNDITAISGLVLEWTRLSDLTGKDTYSDLVQKSMLPLIHPSPPSAELYPGLLPKHVNETTGKFLPDDGGWSHAGGGLYEMLMKNSVYDPVRFAEYRGRWILAADSTIKYLASHPKGHPELTFLADFNGTRIIYNADHSGAFAAASFLLGGAVTGEKRFVDFGVELVESLVKVYKATQTGIGPEAWGWVPDWCGGNEDGNGTGVDGWRELEEGLELKGQESNGTARLGQEIEVWRKESCLIPSEYRQFTSQKDRSFTRRTGYFIMRPDYRLRPEVLESLYYAYRVTGDPKYREWSWEIFQKINEYCRAGSAFAELRDVNVLPDLVGKEAEYESVHNDEEAGDAKLREKKESGMIEDKVWKNGVGKGRRDRMFSYALAEVFMYAFAVHVTDAPWHVRSDNKQEYVFSTEGHPIRVYRPREDH